MSNTSEITENPENRISVVIPTYNASPFIRATLESVFAQTRLPDEVIVVDDCSTDDTVNVIEQLAAQSPVGVRLIRLPTNSRGPARPLNVGIEAAKSEFIATLDHDDRARPIRLEKLLQCFSACDTIGLAFGNVRALGHDPTVQTHVSRVEAGIKRLLVPTKFADCFVLRKQDAYGALIRHHCYAHTCSNFLFRKAVWASINGFDEKITTTCDYRFLQGVAGGHDLGYCSQQICDWVTSRDTLFRTSGQSAINRDLFRVYSSFRLDLLSPADRQLLRAICKECTLGFAYESRQAGLLSEAAFNYLRAIRWSGLTIEAVFGLIKLPLFWFLQPTHAKDRPPRFGT